MQSFWEANWQYILKKKKGFDLKKLVILLVSGEQNWKTGIRDSRESCFSYSFHLCLSAFVLKKILMGIPL